MPWSHEMFKMSILGYELDRTVRPCAAMFAMYQVHLRFGGRVAKSNRECSE
jgi:hypothetical protein